MKFLKLVKGELNKILMRPILYVITGFLVVSLVLSAFIYNPSTRSDGNIKVYDECKTVSSIYNTFNNNTNTYCFNNIDTLFRDSHNLISNTRERNNSTILEDFSTTLTALNTYLETYSTFDRIVVESDIAPQNEMNAYNDVKNCIDSLFLNYKQARGTSNISLNSPLLMTKSTNIEINDLLTTMDDYLRYTEVGSHSSHKELRKKLNDMNFYYNISSYINKIQLKKIDENELTKLDEYLTASENYYNLLYTEIENINSETPTESQANESIMNNLKELCIRSYLVASNASDLVNNSIKYLPILDKNDNEINSYYGYTDIYSYQKKELITKEIFLIKNNKVSTDFGNVFSSTQTSNNDKNAFDFIYYGLGLSSFIIIIFTVVLASGMLAGEQSNGTLKLLMTKPYSRNKIMSAKILASMIFAIIFMIFSTIVLFLIGICVSGINLIPILCVLDANTAFIISPILLLLIYLITIILKLIIFVLISITISTLFRNNMAAVSISIVLYFLLIVLGGLLTNSVWYGFLPFSNFDLFKFFGGSFNTTSNSTLLNMLFNKPIFHNVGFTYSIIMDIAICAIAGVCSYLVFNKREVK